MTSSPTGSATPFSDYTSSRSNRGMADIDVLDVYILKHSADPVLVLLPISRIGTYSEFLSVIKHDLHPGLADDRHAAMPLVYTMDPYMTMSLLRPTLWPDLIPHLRGKRLLVLPGDSPLPSAPIPAPTTPPTAAAATEDKQKRPQTSWTQYLSPKSTPTTPETTRLSVDASPARAHKLPPPPPPAPVPPTPESSRTTAPEVFYTPETTRTAPDPTTNPRRTKAPPPQQASSSGHPRGFRPLTRTDSFLKPPEFGFDISLWCRFAPSYKPGLLMHVQFREITLQVVPAQPAGLDVPAVMAKAASAITNMVRRQGFLRMTSSFRELAVRPGALRIALEDWPSAAGGLAVGADTLRWVAEPVVLFCEVGDVEFVRDGSGGGGREDPRRVEEARRLDDERREAEWRREEARREAERRDEARRDEARMEPKPAKKGRKVKRVQVESEEEVD